MNKLNKHKQWSNIHHRRDSHKWCQTIRLQRTISWWANEFY